MDKPFFNKNAWRKDEQEKVAWDIFYISWGCFYWTGEQMNTVLNPKNWEYLVTRNMSLLQKYIIDFGQINYTHLFLLNFEIQELAITHGMHMTMFESIETRKNLKRRLIELSNKSYFCDKLKKIYKKLGKELIYSVDKCYSDNLENIKISLDNFKEFCESYSKLSVGLPLTTNLGIDFLDILKENLEKELGNKYSKNEIEVFISILTFPDEHSPLRDEEISLLKIATKIQKSVKEDKTSEEDAIKKFDRDLEEHANKFGVIPVNFLDKPWDKNFFIKEVKVLVKNCDCQKKLDELDNSYRELILKRENLKKKLELSEETIQYANILQTTAFLNEYRKFVFCEANLKIRTFLDKIAEKIGLKDWLECSYLTSDEIIGFLKTKPDVNNIKNLIKERENVYCLLSINKEVRLCNKEELEYVLKNFKIKAPHEETKIKKITTLKGSVGSQGFVRGIVKVCFTSKDLSKVNEGDILVAKMTSVDFVPAMKKAAAFVTNEGGITCHAAIVAREMGIPCIIGTKIATTVLKDNDFVEVDANKGIIKILKKS